MEQITYNEAMYILNDFLEKAYRITKLPQFTFNYGLGEDVMGRYFGGKEQQRIELRKEFDTLRRGIDTLLHEAVHYALHTLGKEWNDGDRDFELELVRYGLSSNYSDKVVSNIIGFGNVDDTFFYYNEGNMPRYYYDKVMEQREIDSQNELLIACSKPNNNDAKVKMEKTKVVKLLHELKNQHFDPKSKEYLHITIRESKIKRIPAKNVDALIEAYEDFLGIYVNSGLCDNSLNLCGRGLDEVVLLMNSKVKNAYLNQKIKEWEKYDVL